MQDKIIEVIKERLQPKGMVLSHEADIDQGPVIKLVMKIPFP